MIKKHYLHNYLFIVITCLSITLFACKAKVSSNKDEAIATEKIIELPIIYCDTPINVFENKEIAVNKLKNLMSLSYSTTYAYFSSRSIDTVSKNKYRYSLAKTADSIVKANFKNIKILDNTELLARDYNYIRGNTAAIGYYKKYDKIKNLLIPSGNEKQLFITTTSYNNTKGYLDIFVFNNYKKELLYYSNYKFDCDLRDPFTFNQVVEYAILQLKKSVD